MDQVILALKPEPNDLVVIPEDFVLQSEPEFLVHRMKFLLTPSIIRSGSATMSFFENLSAGKILSWLTGMPELAKDAENENTKRKAVQDSERNKELPKFFRYSRPLDPKNDNTLGPKGGVTFYLELDAPNKTLAFSYSLCHHDDLFNRKTARHISKQRFENGDWYEIKNYDPDLSVTANIKNAINVLLSGVDCSKLEVQELTQFSSVSDRVNQYELNMIFERI